MNFFTVATVRFEILFVLVVLAHDHQCRRHQKLAMACPEPRRVQPPEKGSVVEVLERGGLYRHDERRAA